MMCCCRAPQGKKGSVQGQTGVHLETFYPSGRGAARTKSPLHPRGQPYPRPPSLPVIPPNPTQPQPTNEPTSQPTNKPTSQPVIPSRPTSPGSGRQFRSPYSSPPSGGPTCTTYHCQETKWHRHRGSACTPNSADTEETFFSRRRSAGSPHSRPPFSSPSQPAGQSPSPGPAGQLPLSSLREQLPDGVQRPGHQLHPEADLGVVPAGAGGDRRAGAEDVCARLAAAAVQRPARPAGDCDGAGAKHRAAQNGSREDPEQRSQVLGPGDLRGPET